MSQTTETTPAKRDSSVARNATTWQAWWPAVMMLACPLLSYIDRQTLAILSPMILADLKLNAQKYSEIISAFSLAYILANPLWGSILDRIRASSCRTCWSGDSGAWSRRTRWAPCPSG
jgi:MFS transporter, ACS family, aldohexuronate transporter